VEGGEVVSVRVSDGGYLEVVVKVKAEHIEGKTTDTIDPEPWCEDKGTKTSVTVCAACEKPYKTVVTDVDPVGHIWPNPEVWVVTTDAKLDAEGEETMYCIRDKSHIQTRPFSYSFTEGNGEEWEKGTADGQAFKVERSVDPDGAYDKFEGITIDGAEVAAENYTVTDGVGITLKADYLETLEAGEHTIQANFSDGPAAASFTVTVPSTDATEDSTAEGTETGESGTLRLFVLTGLVAAASLGLVFGLKKKVNE